MPDALVLTAAGSSTRMGGPVKKEYLTISEEAGSRISVLSASLFQFLCLRLFPLVVITVPAGGEAEARAVLAEDRRIGKLLDSGEVDLRFAEGGASRQESVRNGLEEFAKSGETINTVLIHDGARPWVSETVIHAVLESTKIHGASVPAIPVVDTQKEIAPDGRIVRHLDRSTIVSVQTPQGFRFVELLEAHRKAATDGETYTDDTEIWGRYAGDVWICAGDRENRKITYQGDL
jgi:2-C-methyl-D-erythritol 4-phosphate cytidylyltransferase